jgi:CO/xanthine dehydrogenase Mo-binding subunit
MALSRREFTRLATLGGIALSLSPAAFAQTPAFGTRETLPGLKGWNPAATGTGRIDGPAKVTGSKLYASDFRASDLPGWPAKTAHAMLLRADDATHVFEGLDLSRLAGALKPARVVTAEDLTAAGTRVPSFYEGDLFCAKGQTPLYLGQPVGLLIFEDFDAFDQARLALRDARPVTFGRETGPRTSDPYASFRFVRVAGATPDAPDVYSPVQAGWVVPRRFRKSELPVWARGHRRGPADEQASYHGARIRSDLASRHRDWLVLERRFETQSIDPMFLEPEAGLAWFDDARGMLELVVGVQSPQEAAESVATLLGEARRDVRPERIHTHFAYVGGGFGGRDHTVFPLYVALAGAFFPGRPVRLANNRYEQFQSGIKRHAYRIQSRIGIDRKTGRIQAFASDQVLDGGGLANFSPSVASVGAAGAIGIYDIPRADVTTTAIHSRGVTAGSMRGFGTLQSMTALEVLIDEAARALNLDPIEFRRRNALPTGGKTLTGNPLDGITRTDEVLGRLAAHPIWRERAAAKAAAKPGVMVGTGVACVTKDYGTGADSTLCSVVISPEGRIAIRSDAVEMGTAIGTALAHRVARVLGGVADEVGLAEVDAFGALDLVTSGDPYSISQADQDAAARNPRWVPLISAPSSASIGAHISTHGAHEAARIVFRFGLWPAALDLWGIGASDPRAKAWDRAQWKDRRLVMADLPPLDLAAVAARAHQRGGVTGAMVHGFNRWEWARASFGIAGETWTADLDGIAIRTGSGTGKGDGFVRLDRAGAHFPDAVKERIGTVYSSVCGTLVRIEIDRATGALRIEKAYSAVECGQVLVPEVVVGQAQGGFAMGVGQTLLEFLPLYEDGPGNGRWNLGDYVVARASDLPLSRLEVEVLPPLNPDDPPKGMAEVVMIPVVPALLNAIYDATGRRFESLPVTQDMLKGALS